MGIRLNGATSGYVELNAPAVAGTTTLELPTDSIKPGSVLLAEARPSSVSIVSFDNIITSRYDVYEIVWHLGTPNAANNVLLRLRSGGVDVSTGYQPIASGANMGAARIRGNGRYTIQNVRGTGDPVGSGNYYDLYTTAASAVGFWKSGAMSADGFSIVCTAAGTFSGEIYVYGYRKA